MIRKRKPRLAEITWQCNVTADRRSYSDCPHECKCGLQSRNTSRTEIAVQILQLSAAAVGMIGAIAPLIAKLR